MYTTYYTHTHTKHINYTQTIHTHYTHTLHTTYTLDTLHTHTTYYTHTTRHTDNSRSPAPDIAVPRQALCYLSRSNRGLKNRRLFLQHPLFLALVNQGNHKPQNAEPSKRIEP